jgi:hypothetical protein
MPCTYYVKIFFIINTPNIYFNLCIHIPIIIYIKKTIREIHVVEYHHLCYPLQQLLPIGMTDSYQ